MKGPIFSIKRDLKRVIIVLAVIIIPLMYSYFYLSAFWDPYSKLSELPVAVVNEDKGAKINTEQRNLGNELVNELKNNKDLLWVFTNKSDAEEGLKNRKYYASVNITENFSSNIASADSDNKAQGIIIFEPQQKRNYLASQILTKAMMGLENKISEKVSKEIVNTVADENKKMPEKLSELSDGLDKMRNEGTAKLSDGINTLLTSQAKFNNGTSQLNNGLNKANSGAQQLKDGSKQLASKQNEFSKALNSSIPQLTQLSKGSLFFKTNLADLSDGLSKINDGAVLMNSKIPELKKGIQQYSEGLKTFSNSISPLATGMEPLKTGSSQLTSGLSDYSAKMSEFNTGVSQYTESVNTLVDTNKSVADMLTAYVKSHPEAMQDSNIKNIMQVFQNSQGSIDQLNKASQAIKTNAEALSVASSKLAAGSKQVSDGVSKLADGAAPLSKGAAQLAAGAEPLANGLDTLSAGTTQMIGGIGKAAAGAAQLKDGYNQIDAGVQKVSGSVAMAATSSTLLSDATNKLYTSISELNNGIAKLDRGAIELSVNGQKLYNGEKEIYDGSVTLDGKVKEAYDKVKDSETEAKNKVAKLNGLGDFVADPVRIDEKDVDPVSDYGTAFAPYFISLSLWVGALIMFIVIYLNPQIRFKRKLIKGMHMDIKFLIYPLIGIAQALALSAILINILHLKVVDTGMFIAVMLLVSLCFISIVQFLIVNLGDIGKFLAMLMLILQLTASGGTFPNELVPKFFQDISSFMPMTYSIYALKEAISGCNYSFLYNNIIVLTAIMAVFLVASLLLTGNKSAKTLDDIERDLVHKREIEGVEL